MDIVGARQSVFSIPGTCGPAATGKSKELQNKHVNLNECTSVRANTTPRGAHFQKVLYVAGGRGGLLPLWSPYKGVQGLPPATCPPSASPEISPREPSSRGDLKDHRDPENRDPDSILGCEESLC